MSSTSFPIQGFLVLSALPASLPSTASCFEMTATAKISDRNSDTHPQAMT